MMHVKDVHGVVQQEVVLMDHLVIRFDCGKLNWVLLVYSLNCANNTQARSKQCRPTIGPATVLWDHAHYLCNNRA